MVEESRMLMRVDLVCIAGVMVGVGVDLVVLDRLSTLRAWECWLEEEEEEERVRVDERGGGGRGQEWGGLL